MSQSRTSNQHAVNSTTAAPLPDAKTQASDTKPLIEFTAQKEAFLAQLSGIENFLTNKDMSMEMKKMLGVSNQLKLRRVSKRFNNVFFRSDQITVKDPIELHSELNNQRLKLVNIIRNSRQLIEDFHERYRHHLNDQTAISYKEDDIHKLTLRNGYKSEALFRSAVYGGVMALLATLLGVTATTTLCNPPPSFCINQIALSAKKINACLTIAGCGVGIIGGLTECITTSLKFYRDKLSLIKHSKEKTANADILDNTISQMAISLKKHKHRALAAPASPIMSRS